MTRKSFLVFLAVFFVSIASMDRLKADNLAAQPNIIFVYADDMGWTGTSVEMFEGNTASKSDFYQTPNLEKLAAKGMVFSQAYSPGPMCTPSRASVLTGITPAELHITTPGGRARTDRKILTPQTSTQLPAELPTTGTNLQAAGYATALLGKWHIGRGDDAGNHGFQVNDGPTQNESNGTDEDPKSIFSLTQRGIEFMEENVKAEKPFFLQLSHYAVHAPIQSRPESIAQFEKSTAGKIHHDPSYGGMTWDLDTSLAAIFDAVEQLGISENTYIVFMSDNGAQGNRRNQNNLPLFAGKGTLYEGGIRVPLIVVGPGIESGYCSQPVTGTDLFTTFATWAGAELESNESEDLTPLLTGRESEFKRSRDLFFHFPHYGRGTQTPQTALIVGNWKLLRDWEAGKDQLFDLNEDIGESSDVSTKNPEVHQEMIKSMENRLQQTNAQLPKTNPDYDPSAEPNNRRGNRNGRDGGGRNGRTRNGGGGNR
jgi:arylsulfatase A-like enzyme